MKRKILLILSSLIISVFVMSGCNFDTIYMQPKTPLEGGGNSASEILGAYSEKTGSVKISLPSAPEHTGNEVSSSLYAAEVSKNKMPAVLNIVVQSLSTNQSSAGTGFIINKDGYVVTNAHVILYDKVVREYVRPGQYIQKTQTVPFEEIYASFNYAPEKFFIMEVVDYNITLDLAVIKFDERYYFNDNDEIEIVCEFASSANLLYGEPVVAIGNAQGLGLSVTFGGISNPYVEKYKAILISVPINPGNSGGPLFNTSSNVVGVNSSKLVDASTDNMGFAIPSDTVMSYIDGIAGQIAYTLI